MYNVHLQYEYYQSKYNAQKDAIRVLIYEVPIDIFIFKSFCCVNNTVVRLY